MADDATSLLSPRLKRCLAERGIQQLNDFQRAAIPPIHAGDDALLIAPTAGGKTEAALLPLLERSAAAEGEGARIVYVAPLRALLNDIQPRIEAYARALGLRVFKWHGDVSATDKHGAEQNPPDILLITPESIEVILVTGRSPERLFGALQSVVVDEVHYFAMSGRGAHLLSLLARLEGIVGHRTQRVGLSATVGNPGAVLEWLSRETGTGRLITPPAAATVPRKERIWEVLVVPSEEIAPALLPRLVRASPPGTNVTKIASRSIVFCRSRNATEDLSAQLESEAERHPGIDFRYHVHHGSVGKNWREAAEREIRLSDIHNRAIFSTSTLELGIDLGDLDLVGQAGGMGSVSSFLQRVGRVGRREGRPQWFVSLNIRIRSGEEDDLEAAWPFLENLAVLNLGARGVVEDVKPVPRAFHVLAQQILAISVAEHGFRRDRHLPLLLGVRAFADIGGDEVEAVLEHMLVEDYLRSVPPHLVPGEAAEKRYLRRNMLPLYSVFDTPPEFVVLDGSNEVGTVQAGYVMGREVPFVLRLAGHNWEVQEVSVERGIVKARPTKEALPPHWFSLAPGTSRIVVEEIARILDGAPLEEPICLAEAAAAWLGTLRRTARLPVQEPGVVLVRPQGAAMCSVAALAGDREMMTFQVWLRVCGLQSASCGPLELTITKKKEHEGIPLRHQEVADQLRVLGRADPQEALSLIADRFDDECPYNKFASCVPPGLRQLHLAAAFTDVIGARSFRVDTTEQGE